MKETSIYTDEWQPYEPGTYEKFEYDLKLKKGGFRFNFYPNAGFFSELNGSQKIDENEVAEIRLSQHPVTYMNNKVSNKFRRDEEKELDK